MDFEKSKIDFLKLIVTLVFGVIFGQMIMIGVVLDDHRNFSKSIHKILNRC